MIRKTIAIIGTLAVMAVLAACSLTTEQQAAVGKAYDATCKNEPALYQSFVLVATAKQASDKTMKRAETIHLAAMQLCETRPTDLASAAVQIAALYAQLVTISAQVERAPPPTIAPS